MQNKERFAVLFVAFGLTAAAGFLAAVQAPAAKAPLEIPRFTTAPKIDGVLDNPVWESQALKIDAFVQLSPKENGVPTEKTTAYLGYDEKNLYVAFRCLDSQASKIRCSVTNRDDCMEDDWIFIMLDTFNEKRRAFSFLLNPIGVQMDMMRIEEGGNDNMDDSWDTVFLSDGKVDAEGYTVEAAIPFKSLRFPKDDIKTWNIVLGRNLPRTGEIILHPHYSRDIPGLLSNGQAFTIRGAVERSRNIEVMPFLTSLIRKGEDVQRGEKVSFGPGANFKYGLSSNMTLDLTANPDFSQIEADEPKIDYNLRYALRYAEKRPFFLEGMEIFSSPEIETVYTRQITDPIFGGKFSGKSGRFTYGLLSAYDMHPTESLWEIPDGAGTADTRAFSNIFRTKADVGSGSYVGFTLTDKELGGGSWSRLGGLDGQLRFNNKVFFSFQALASKSSGAGDRTALAPGLYGELYYTNKHWTFGGFYKAMHPDFQASLGFVNRTDYRSAGGFASFRIYPDKKYLNQVQFRLQAGKRDGYADSVTQDTWLNASAQFRLTEFNQVFVLYENSMERFAATEFKKRNISVEGETQFISWMPFGFFFQTGDSVNYDPDDAFLGYSNTYGLYVKFKPSKRLQMGVDFSKQTFWRSAGGERLWDYNVIRQRTTYQLSKTISFRAIVDYNFFYKEAFGSLLVSWVLRPGTVFFLGYDKDYLRDEFGRRREPNSNVFIKFSYWWRL